MLVCLAAIIYIVLSAIFPGKTEYLEIEPDPKRTGDEQIDALLVEGEGAVSEMRKLNETIADEHVRQKCGKVISVTEMIFGRLHEDSGSYKQIRRFADFYLPTTLKLLHTYDRFGKTPGAGNIPGGGNISETLERIDTALDTIYVSYKKFFDSLFEKQALDIETDIRVLETMLKKEGLLKDI